MFPAIPYSRYIVGQLPWYSVLIVTGILTAILLCSREEKRLGLPKDTVLDLALWVIPFGIVGARLYYVVFSWNMFAGNPLSILYVWEGGLAIYGGVIGGLIAIFLFARKRGISPFLLTDMIVPTLSLAQAIGRWGNYFNMEAYGAAITDPAWQFFPAAVLIPEGGAYVWHMATFFYESVWDLTVFLLLWFLIRKISSQHGTVTLWYMVLYGTGRFLIEGLRTDSLVSGQFRVSQMLSAVLVLTGTVLLIIRFFLSHQSRQKEAS